jgi:hypothetical protein
MDVALALVAQRLQQRPVAATDVEGAAAGSDSVVVVVDAAGVVDSPPDVDAPVVAIVGEAAVVDGAGADVVSTGWVVVSAVGVPVGAVPASDVGVALVAVVPAAAVGVAVVGTLVVRGATEVAGTALVVLVVFAVALSPMAVAAVTGAAAACGTAGAVSPRAMLAANAARSTAVTPSSTASFWNELPWPEASRLTTVPCADACRLMNLLTSSPGW